MRSLLLAVVCALGCTEYGIKAEEPGNLGGDDTSEPEETLPVLDTADTAEPEDTAGSPNDEEPPPADAPVYANTGGQLYEVEPATGARTLIGTFVDEQTGAAVTPFVDIAIDLEGRMYGGTFDALYQIDPTDASVREICSPEAGMVALTFTSDGELIAGGDDGVNIINVNNCRVTPLTTQGGYQTSGDLVGLPDGYLYWTVEGSSRDALVRIDPLTGSTTYIGDVGYSEIYGLGYDDGELFGFNSYGETIVISPSTADSSVLTSDSSTSWYGATTNPVQW